MPSMQETFDTVVAHARSMPKRSIGELDGRCLYRGPQRNKCFVGCLIPDENYVYTMEGRGASEDLISSLLIDLGHNVSLCCALQLIHDNHGPLAWEDLFQRTAERYKLEYRAPEVAIA